MHHLTAPNPLLPRNEIGRSTGRGVPKIPDSQSNLAPQARWTAPKPPRLTNPHPPTGISYGAAGPRRVAIEVDAVVYCGARRTRATASARLDEAVLARICLTCHLMVPSVTT